MGTLGSEFDGKVRPSTDVLKTAPSELSAVEIIENVDRTKLDSSDETYIAVLDGGATTVGVRKDATQNHRDEEAEP